jgi:hypothetical protein
MSAAATSGVITVSDASEAFAVTYSYHPGFYQRCAHLMTMTCLAVCAESTATDNHASRKSRALQWLSNCNDPGAQIALAMAVLADLSISFSSTSQQIADRIASIFDKLSGV